MVRNKSGLPPPHRGALLRRPLSVREMFALLAFGVLLLSVTTNLLAFHFHETEILPVRPVLIILGLGALVLIGAVPFSIHFPTVAWIMILGLGLRFVDAALLKRYVDFADGARNNTGFALVFFCVSYVGLRLGLRARNRLAAAVIVCAVVALGSIVVDYFVPGSFPVTSGRAAGYFVNSNGASFALAVLVFAMTPLITSNALRIFAVCVTIFGCFLTLSRGGFLALLTGVFVFAQGNLRSRGLLLAGAALMMTFVALSVAADQLQPGNEELNSRARLLLGREAGVVDDSGRIRLLIEGIKLGAESPWLGYGATYSGSPRTFSGQGPHNLYVGLFMDEGLPGALFGFVMMGVLGAYCFKRCRDYLPLYLVLFVTSFFNHNLMESSVFLFAVALICVAGEASYFGRGKA